MISIAMKRTAVAFAAAVVLAASAAPSGVVAQPYYDPSYYSYDDSSYGWDYYPEYSYVPAPGKWSSSESGSSSTADTITSGGYTPITIAEGYARTNGEDAVAQTQGSASGNAKYGSSTAYGGAVAMSKQGTTFTDTFGDASGNGKFFSNQNFRASANSYMPRYKKEYKPHPPPMHKPHPPPSHKPSPPPTHKPSPPPTHKPAPPPKKSKKGDE